MFGYVAINKSELKFREFDEYRSYYCGLCQRLKKKYGCLGQISLSYDMTFLTMLLSSLYEPENTRSNCRCIAHPFEKHPYCYNEITDYVADMNLLLCVYKCNDDWEDEKKIFKKCWGDIIRKRSKKQQVLYGKKDTIIRNLLDKMHELEKANSDDVDKMADLFGQIMSVIFVYKEDEWSDSLSKIGYLLGKFVYLMDAYDDIEKDIKKHNYNPLISRFKNENFEEYGHVALTVIMSECCQEFEMLPLIENVDILRNILYSGVWGRFEEVSAKRKAKKEQ